jgi:hypothetical protein
MSDRCELKAVLEHGDVPCDEDGCTFWRAVEHLDVDCDVPGQGCAIQYFGLLEGGEGVAAWLLSVKERVDGVLAEGQADS